MGRVIHSLIPFSQKSPKVPSEARREAIETKGKMFFEQLSPAVLPGCAAAGAGESDERLPTECDAVGMEK